LAAAGDIVREDTACTIMGGQFDRSRYSAAWRSRP